MAEKKATFLTSFLIFLNILIDNILEFILGWYFGPKKRVQKVQDKGQELIVSKTAVELAQLIRERKLKSYDVVKAYFERVEVVKLQINAVVDGPFSDALKEATQIDRRLDNNEYSESELKSKPFLGVPFTTKDSTAVAGKLQTLGLVSRKSLKAEEDAECIRLMKNSGAIIIATSNVPEINMWCETRNNLIGQTNNPYDLRRSAGGSSGGEAALISSCCTAFGLGTDIGGSIRIPAFKCGIFGHKPTKFAVDTRGCTFRTGKEEQTMMVVGPMTRFSRDLMPIFKVLVRPEMMQKLQLDLPVDLKKLRYFYIPSNNSKLCNPVNHETQMVMYQIRRHFQNLSGKEVQLLKLPGIEYSHKLWRYWMTQETSEFSKLLGNGTKVNPFLEILKKLVGKSEFTMAAIYGLINSVLPPEKEEKMREITSKMKRILKEVLGDDGVLFYHSSPRTATFHYYPLIKFGDISYFSIFNVLQTPTTQVPMGLDSNGMPMGIQVVANEMNDRLCLAVAGELERAFGGWVPPYNISN